MRIHLISPTHRTRDGALHKTTRYWTSGVTLPYLKALTPPPHSVDFTDELMADLDVDRIERDADVVGITAMGPQIGRAYELADHFRARGKKVVLGGRGNQRQLRCLMHLFDFRSVYKKSV
jgi:bacteriochlorophyll C8 methyltransferase